MIVPANAALPRRLAQIATDGAKKIPQRRLEPLAINAAQGRHCPATLPCAGRVDAPRAQDR